MSQIKTKLLLLFLFTIVFLTIIKAQDKKIPVPAASKEQNPASNPTPPKTGPKPYKEVITDKAKTFKGLFIVHKVEDKWFFEIPDSLIGREILAITRIAKTATGAGFGGEEVNEQVLKFEKGPDNKIFLRVAFYVNVASDTLPIYQAVKSSNVEPIAAAFDVKAFGKDSASTVIEVTDFFKGDNQVVSIP
ncbi:MAG TPA: DUF5117 domain-containing protein, partial [Puia sp.]|nr:DUF5117 domain-containing protein [Puia sp.]